MYRLYYTDSIGIVHELEYRLNSYLNLMEFIRDQSYEDWGDCRGRAWCATCHVSIIGGEELITSDMEENSRLSKMSNKIKESRLACQIPLDAKLHLKEIVFIGED